MSPPPKAKTLRYEPDYAVAPGETLLEKIQELGMTQTELAMRVGLSQKHISQIINGKQPITQKTAIGLERATGIPAHFWNNRESIYRERVAKLKEAERLSQHLCVLNEVPLKELVQRGIISRTRDKTIQLREVLTFFGVSDVAALHKLWNSRKAAARRSRVFESRPGATATWLRLGELEAQNIECGDYDKRKFAEAVENIGALTTDDVLTFVPQMKCLCALAGVAVVFVQEIRKAPWYGASWWLTPKKAVIELNLRGKTEDQFWFSFFHEAGHILKEHGKRGVFINVGSQEDPIEQEANEFAENMLIPKDRREEIPDLNRTEMLQFAEDIGISVGIVAGQYQRMTGIHNRRWVHALKRKFQWVPDPATPHGKSTNA